MLTPDDNQHLLGDGEYLGLGDKEKDGLAMPNANLGGVLAIS